MLTASAGRAGRLRGNQQSRSGTRRRRKPATTSCGGTGGRNDGRCLEGRSIRSKRRGQSVRQASNSDDHRNSNPLRICRIGLKNGAYRIGKLLGRDSGDCEVIREGDSDRVDQSDLRCD